MQITPAYLQGEKGKGAADEGLSIERRTAKKGTSKEAELAGYHSARGQSHGGVTSRKTYQKEKEIDKEGLRFEYRTQR